MASQYDKHKALNDLVNSGLLTKEQIIQAIPQAASDFEEPSVMAGGVKNLGLRGAELVGNLATVNAKVNPFYSAAASVGESFRQTELGQKLESFVPEEYRAESADQAGAKFIKMAESAIPRQQFHSDKFSAEPFSVENLYKMTGEQGLSSVADMAAVSNPVTGAAYFASESQRIADDFAVNDGREKASTVEDYARGVGGGAVNFAMEKVGAKVVGKFMDEAANPFVKQVEKTLDDVSYDGLDLTSEGALGFVGQTAKNFGVGAAVEGGTEFIQEGSEYAFSTAGTDKFSGEQMLANAGTGALLGGMVGGHLKGAGTAYQKYQAPNQQTVDDFNEQAYNAAAGQGTPPTGPIGGANVTDNPASMAAMSTTGLSNAVYGDQSVNMDMSDPFVESTPFNASPTGALTGVTEQGINNTVGEQDYTDNIKSFEASDAQSSTMDNQAIESFYQPTAPVLEILNRQPDIKQLSQPFRSDKSYFTPQETGDLDVNVLNNLANKAAGLDKVLTEHALKNPNSTVENKVQALDHIINQTEYYTNARKVYDKYVTKQTAGKTQQARQDLSAKAREQKVNKNTDQLRSTLREMKPNKDYSLAQMQKSAQDLASRKAANSANLQGMAKSFKANKKRVKRRLMRDMESKLNDVKYERAMQSAKLAQEKIETPEYTPVINPDINVTEEITKAYEQAKEIGIDRDFNIMASALTSLVKEAPAEVQAEEQAKVEQVIVDWVADQKGAYSEKPQAMPENTSTEFTAITQQANEAATSPTNDLAEPTQAQKDAGNYKKGKVKIQGLDISVENPKGSQRKGIDSDGKPWSTTMNHHYGDIKKTSGADGDPIDVFIGESVNSEKVFVVDQNDVASGEFDEHKVMIGFDTIDDAKKAYLSNYNKGFSGFGEITETTMNDFKGWIAKPRKSKQPFAQPTKEQSTDLRVETLGKAVIIKGDTKPIKDAIKAKGGSWNNKHQGWIFPASKRDIAEGIINNSKPKADSTNQSDKFYESLVSGDSPSNLIQFKKKLAQDTGKEFKDITLEEVKQAQEQFEGALIKRAREIASSGKAKDVIYNELVELYKAQPNLNVKSSTSVRNMAYSTPVPISYLVNLVAGVDSNTTVFEPTAGNGMLLVNNVLENTTVNELDPKRIEQLKWLGYDKIKNKDATGIFVKPNSQDVVIMNPPFGNFDGNYEVRGNDGDVYKLEDIDHVIAAKQLTAMNSESGTAFLILGANKEAGKVQGGKTGKFLNWLYNTYNVVDHIELDGNVYSRQGAAWPVRMIAIQGKSKVTDNYAPDDGVIQRIEGKSDEILQRAYEHYESKGLLDTVNKRVKPTGEGNSSNANNQQVDNKGNTQKSESGDRAAATSTQTARNKSTTGSGNDTRVGSGNESGATSGRNDANSTQSGVQTGSEKGTGVDSKQGETSGPRTDQKPKSVGKVKSDISDLSRTSKANEFQSNYKTASGGFNDKILTPVNMAGNTQKALTKVHNKHGSVDEYVTKELGYKSVAQMHDAFMGLQVDGVALAIDKISNKKSIIIADQTGVGKGRQAAGVIRYALKQGKIPVFITQKANLFSDMYGDLKDIGTDNVTPFIFNGDEQVTFDGKGLFKNNPNKLNKGLSQMNQGEMPDGSNAIFLTYSQINTPNKKQEALKGISENAIFILDESHTAAGADSNTNEFLVDALLNSSGALYLSATYAKRPDNFSLYNKTSIGDAIDSQEELVDGLNEGGLQLQTLLASMMSQEGELIRREKSFEGIKINTFVDFEKSKEHEKLFNNATTVLRDIVSFSEGFKRFVKSATPKQKNQVGYIGEATVDKDTKPTSFTSVVHNYIAQLTLSIKAEVAADKAIKAFKDGEKPVIALENTMESKLNNYMARNNLSVGDDVSEFSFADIMLDALENATKLSVKNRNGDKEEMFIPPSEFPAGLRNKYNAILSRIDNADLSGLPVSPIDYIRKRLIDEGIKVQEITGRGKFIDYSDGMEIKNKPVEESKKNRQSIVNSFNNGDIDAVILNQSGSTGLSLHAKIGLKDRKPRRMIVAQPSLDINVFMQMLGRINRTGQGDVLPLYDIMWLDLPSENRPATVLSNKMKSLNAQTSANTDSATSIESVDIFNKYGNEVVKDYLEENPEILRRMSLDQGKVENNQDELAQFITGKLALLPVAEQQDFFDAVESNYTDLIATLKATGEYALETLEYDLDAKPLEQEIMVRGENTSAFNGDIKLTLANVKSQGKPPSPDDVAQLYENVDRDSGARILDKYAAEFNDYISSRFDDREKSLKQLVNEAKDIEEANKYSADLEALRQKRNSDIGKNADLQLNLTKRFVEGASIQIETQDKQIINGIIQSVGHKHKSGKGNPFAPSKFKVRILTASGSGGLTYNLSQLMNGKMQKINHLDRLSMERLFEREYQKPQRENRSIITGNLIKAFSMLKGSGKVVSFTTKSGESEIGILLNKGFQKERDLEKQTYAKSAEQISRFLNDAPRAYGSKGVENKDGFRIFMRDGVLTASVPVNNAESRKRYANVDMTNIVGELFYSKGDKQAIVDIDQVKLKSIVEILNRVSPIALTGESAKYFNQANGVSNSNETVPQQNIRFNKTTGKPKGVKVKAAKLAMNKFLTEYKGLVDDTFETFITDREPEDVFPNATAEQLQGTIKGGFDKETNTVIIFAQNHENAADLQATIREELLVHKGLGVFNKEEISGLIQAIADTRSSTNKGVKDAWVQIDKDYKGFSEEVKAEEFLGKISHKQLSTLDKYVNKVMTALTKLMRKFGLVRDGITPTELRKVVYDISDKLRAGKEARNFEMGDLAFNKTTTPVKTANAISEFISDKRNVSLRKWALKVVPIDQLIDVYDSKHTDGKIQEHYDILGDFQAYKANKLESVEERIENRWDTLQGNSPKANIVMSRVMHHATMTQLSPDREFDKQDVIIDIDSTIASINNSPSKSDRQMDYEQDLLDRRAEYKDSYDMIRKDWEWMQKNSPESVKLYKDVRQEYINTYEETKRLLLERIGELEMDGSVRKVLMAKIKFQFEKNIIKGDYFPLMRSGIMKVVAKKDGEYIREHYDNQRDARKAAQEWKQLGYKTVVQKMPDPDFSNDKNGAYELGKELIGTIENMKETATDDQQLELTERKKDAEEIQSILSDIPLVDSNALIDAIYQQMLQTLPNQSAAKRFIHRNRVRGASTDMRRAFANTIFHSINRAAKIKFEHTANKPITEITEMADSQNIDGDEQTIIRDLSNSLIERMDMTMNPNTNPLIAKLSGLGFNWFLGGSVAAGLVNTTQVPLVAAPYFAARYGFAKTTATMTSAYAKYFSKGVLDTDGLNTFTKSSSLIDLSESSKVDPRQKKMLKDLQHNGRIDVTQMQTIGQIAETETRDVEGSKLLGISHKNLVKVQRAWGFFFHNAEVVNRQVTALMAMELELGKNPTISDAALYKVVASAIDATQFNYAAYNRGVMTRSNAGKMLFMFMTYSVNITLLMAKNIKRSFKGDAESKAQARKFMGYIVLSQLVFAGTLGIPLFEAFGEMIAKLMNQVQDEPVDFQEFMDESIRVAVGALGGDPKGELAKETSTIVRKGLINGITGINVADRVGMNNMWFRMNETSDKSARQTLEDIAMNLTPISSIIINTADGASNLIGGALSADGEQLVRGFEKAMPKAVGDVAKSLRRSIYGENNRYGSELINAEEFTALDAISQGIGFSTERTRGTYERRSWYNNFNRVVSNNRSQIIKQAVKAVKAGDNKGIDEIITKISAFNEKHPSRSITADTIYRSISIKQTIDNQTVDGVRIPNSRGIERDQMRYYDTP